MDNDFLISIFRYFAQYVPTAALERMMVSPDGSAEQGANETITEAIKNNKRADAEIDAYIFTANASLVADLMRNSAGTVLFVEYGKSVFDANGMALSIDVAVTFACPYNSSNKDNVNEFLICNAMQNKLLQLLSQMKEDSDHGCSCGKFILPSEIQPVEPSAFYNHVGFTAFIKIQSPVLSAQSVMDYLNTSSSYGSNPLSNYYTKSQSDARFAFKSDIVKRNAYKRITKIADYLYLTEYAQEDIDYSNADNTPVSGACSMVRQGGVWARNFDWYWNNDCEFIVKTNAHKGRFASIGVASVTGLTKEMVESGEYSDLYKQVPLRIVDGINTAGIGICTNVVPADFGTTNQERGKQKIKSSLVARYILDHHYSAYLALCDIRDNFDMQMVGGMEVHWACGDANHTYLLEYINGEGVVTDITAKPIMTNFHLHGVSDIDGAENPTLDWNTVENHGMGLERYDLIRTLLQSGMSVREFMPNNLLYSNAYTSVNPLRWKTEFTGITETFGDITIHSTDEEFMPVITEGRNRYEQGRNGGAWITCHTSVYDMVNLVLYIHTQEGETEFKFYLDPHYCEIKDNITSDESTWSSSKINSAIVANKPVWGSIEGNIDNQEDLKRKLNKIKRLALGAY